MLAIVRQFAPNSGQTAVKSRRPFLASGRLEALDRHPHGDARAAVIAVWAIGECTAATESKTNQFAVDASVDQVAGSRYLRARRPFREIAARIGRRGIKLQRREREVVQLAHDSINGPRSHPTGAVVECINSDKCAANTRREMGRAPNDARRVVSCWQSIIGTPRRVKVVTSPASATFEASVSWVNIDSPKKTRSRTIP